MDLIEFWATWWWLAALTWGATWIVLGYGLGLPRGRGATGALLGFALGPLGTAITFTLGQLDEQEAARRTQALRDAEDLERRLPPQPAPRRSP